MKNIEELKSQHPDLYAQVFDAGVASEKDRVMAHIEMANGIGAYKFALECISKGETLSQTVIAKYTAFGLNNQEKKDRQDENFENVETKPEAQGEDTEKEEKETEKETALAAALKVDLSAVKGE